jgi:outer membrane protein OmpA-like peptidoglycan-associated protein
MASVAFISQSAEINAAGRVELDRAAQAMQRTRAVELRSYAGGTDPIDARKIALARALAVRSYLIDRGVKTRIDVGDFGATDSGEERVDVIVP